MKKSNWLLVIGAVLLVLWFRHSSTPNLPLPETGVVHEANLRIPVTMTPSDTPQEYWNLAKQADGHYVVQVSMNHRVTRQFTAGAVLQTSSLGAKYASQGVIQLEGERYQATDIFVNTDGTSGYIDLTKSGAATNQTS